MLKIKLVRKRSQMIVLINLTEIPYRLFFSIKTFKLINLQELKINTTFAIDFFKKLNTTC